MGAGRPPDAEGPRPALVVERPPDSGLCRKELVERFQTHDAILVCLLTLDHAPPCAWGLDLAGIVEAAKRLRWWPLAVRESAH